MSAHARPYTASTPDPVHQNIARNLRGMIAHLPHGVSDGDLIELWQCAADMTDWELVDAIDEMVDELVRVDDLLIGLDPQPRRHPGQVTDIHLDGQLPIGDRRLELERDLLVEGVFEVG